FGLFRDIFLSYLYGASNISDAYLVSLTIPTVIFSFVGIGISAGYIPIFSEIEKCEGKKESINYTNNLINILLVLSAIIIIICVIFADKIVFAFASGFDDATLNLATNFTRISLFSLFFLSLLYVFNGFLQIRGNY